MRWLRRGVPEVRLETWAYDVLAFTAIVTVLCIGLSTTEGVLWPPDPDHFRDIAQAQTTLDGHPMSDAMYAGEWIWYNPLVPWVIALGSAITRMEVAAFHVASGPWLNLAAPVMLYVLVARLASRSASLMALVFFLFWTTGTEQSWTAATYSPWLFAGAFAQALFYGIALVAIGLLEKVTARRIVGAGVLLGVAFMTHTAAAVMSGLLLLPVLVRALAAKQTTWRHVLLLYGVAVMVSLPYLWSIVGHYRLHVYNAAPMNWRHVPLTPGGISQLWTLQTPAILMLACVGLGAFLDANTRQAYILYAWLAASIGLTAYGVYRELLPSLPAIVSAFHFWLYVTAWQSVMAGIGSWVLIGRIFGRRRSLAFGVTVILALVLTVRGADRFQHRAEVVDGRNYAIGRDPNFELATRFLRKTTDRSDVVLGTYGAANLIIGPAGRPTVGAHYYFSNPYVPYEPRAQDRETMLAALERGKSDEFKALNQRYGVTTVVGVGPVQCDGLATSSVLQHLYAFGSVCIYRVRGSQA